MHPPTHTICSLTFATNNKAPIKGPYYYIHNRKSVNVKDSLNFLSLKKLVAGARFELTTFGL